MRRIASDDPIASRAARLATYGRVSTFLRSLDDQRLGGLLDRATPTGSGIGGASMVLELEDAPVFVKCVALTDLEQRAEHLQSTRNLFHLPPLYHYGVGVGSTGFGAWRELAVHRMTTGWVLSDEHQGFPLMYHWRVLPGTSGLHGDLERAVEYWEGSSSVRARLQAIAESSAHVVLFLEYIPLTLHDWLTARVAEGGQPANAAYALVARSLRVSTSFMRSRGLLHFDAHFHNILTDGRLLYFADFGLAMTSGFDLAEDESEFFHRHRSYDQTYTATHVVNWLISALCGAVDRDAVLRECAAGKKPVDLPPGAAAIVSRYAPLAIVMNEFYRKLQAESPRTPYPVEATEHGLFYPGVLWPKAT